MTVRHQLNPLSTSLVSILYLRIKDMMIREGPLHRNLVSLGLNVRLEIINIRVKIHILGQRTYLQKHSNDFFPLFPKATVGQTPGSVVKKHVSASIKLNHHFENELGHLVQTHDGK